MELGMPLHLECQPPVPRPRWSVRRIVGFALCVVGMPIGLGLVMLISGVFHVGNSSLIVKPVPLLTGIALSIVGLIQAGSRTRPARGCGFAIAGLLIALGWTVLTMLIGICIILNMRDPGMM